MISKFVFCSVNATPIQMTNTVKTMISLCKTKTRQCKIKTPSPRPELQGLFYREREDPDQKVFQGQNAKFKTYTKTGKDILRFWVSITILHFMNSWSTAITIVALHSLPTHILPQVNKLGLKSILILII